MTRYLSGCLSAHRPARWRELLLAGIALSSFVAVMLVGPIALNLSYHDFADNRTMFGIPNFANVMSNILFLVIGIVGFARCIGHRKTGAWLSWAVFFVGVALVGVGSGYYHIAPQDQTLVWDRLPMTVAFMGLFSALLSEHLGEGFGRRALLPLVLLGTASVIWWYYTNDLRFYAWVQLAPFLMIPFVLALFPSRFTHRTYLLYGLGCYVLAKGAEFYDRELFELTSQILSGHSAKHLLASFGALFVYIMILRREPIDTAS